MSVVPGGRPSPTVYILPATREFTLERVFMSAVIDKAFSVCSSLIQHVIFLLVGSLRDVLSVAKPLVSTHSSFDIRRFTMERNLTQ